MYSDLQALYIPSNASISQRPSCTTTADIVKIRSDREPSYESVDITLEDDDETPSYLNIHQSLIRQSEEVGEDDDERYKNITSPSARNTIVEAIYDKINFSLPEVAIERDTVRNKEDYYNVVAVEDEIYTDTIQPQSELNTLHLPSTAETHRKEKPPLKPKPAPRNIKYTPAAANDVEEIDYYESAGSILTINDDQLVV